MSSQDYPLLARAHNQITEFFVNLYAWDRFITVAIVANICVAVFLVLASLHSIRQPYVGAAASTT